MATPKHRHQRPQHLRIAFALALGLIFSLLVIDAAHAQRVTLAARNLTEADTATNTLDAGNSHLAPFNLRLAPPNLSPPTSSSLSPSSLTPPRPPTASGSPTPQQVATRFGIADDHLASRRPTSASLHLRPQPFPQAQV